MMKSAVSISVCLALGCFCASAQQETAAGISVPVTLSGNAVYSRTSPEGEGYPGRSITAGFRGVVAPTLSMGTHWFAYFALEAHSSSYFSYKTGLNTDRNVYVNLMQGFLGYTVTKGNMTVLVKSGQLASAFGAFPLEYDESKTPFPNPPPGYATTMPLRPDQRPCGVKDLVFQNYAGEIDFRCGGSSADAYGLLPVTLYGLPGLETQISVGRVDARLQLTNSSPVNPQPLWSRSQSLQWTAGAGYTPGLGLRLGMSAFRGAYLDSVITDFRKFPATAVGVDAQWALGRWSAEGEWQRFQFDLPGFTTSPTERVAYAQLKAIVSPRTFLAARFTSLTHGHVQDASGIAANTFTPAQQIAELAFGYRPNRYHLVKTGVTWTNRDSWSEFHTYWPEQRTIGAQIQLVISLPTLSRAF